MRWESAELLPLEPGDLDGLRRCAASDLAAEVKAAKNLLKNTLSGPAVYRLLRFARIGRAGDILALQDTVGGTIALGDLPGMEPTTARLTLLPDPSLLESQVLLGPSGMTGRSGA